MTSSAIAEDLSPVLFSVVEESRSSQRHAALGDYVGYESTLKPMIREFTMRAVARELDCQLGWTTRVRIGTVPSGIE
jgi:hypothetical protein